MFFQDQNSIASGVGADAPHLNEYDELDKPGVEVDDQPEMGNQGWLKLARDAYDFSTSFLDTNYRKKWDDSIRAFNNQHSSDSKYNQPGYSKRSNIFRPKTRSIIRKNEAAGAAAFFSNMDIVNVDAQHQSDKVEQASAELMKQILQYRLTKSIPWFQIVMGGLQDAQTIGASIAHIHWSYKTRDDKVIEDKPVIDLIPVENFRIDPGAQWYDPIGTSPYIIHLIPMYVGDVKSRMEMIDDKTGQAEWKEFSEGDIRRASTEPDSTRQSRNKQREDPYANRDQPISDYETVWIQRHIHRRDGRDWTFYTLGDIGLLSDPKPLEQEVFHGMRPYVAGCAILETHKVFPAGVPELTDGLQKETNEIANQRLDNIKFVLNKRWFVKRGKNTDLSSLVRNIPGGVTMTDDPENDVKEVNWPDVTGSSYQEQDRINADISDLIGDFSPAQAQLSRKGNEPARLAQLMANQQSPMVEYLLRTFTVTFVEQILRQLAKLEQAYETDEVVLEIARDKAQLFQRYGINQVTDQLLNKELTLSVNIGMGATDPVSKLNRFVQAASAYTEIATSGVQNLNMEEIAKEIFGHAGYQDGKRFFTGQGQDPQAEQAMQQAKQMIDELKQENQHLKSQQEVKAHELMLKAKVAEDDRKSKLQEVVLKNETDRHNTELKAKADIVIAKMGHENQKQINKETLTMQNQQAEKESKNVESANKESSKGISLPNIKLDPVINVETKSPIINVEAPIINIPEDKPRTKRIKKVANGEWLMTEE